MSFSPTTAQIHVAQDLFIAMSYYDTVATAFDRFENEILRSGKFYFDSSLLPGRLRLFPWLYKQKRITSRKDLPYIAGLRQYGTAAYAGSDCEQFYMALDNKALAAGFLHGALALQKAETDVFICEDKLILLTRSIHGITPNNIVAPEHRIRLIEGLLKQFAPLVHNALYEYRNCQFLQSRKKEV